MTTKHQPGSFEAISEADGKAHIEIMKSVQHEILAKLREHRANPMNDKEAVVWIVHRSDPVLYPLAPEVRRKATSIVDVSSRSDWLELARDRPTMVPTPIYERIRDMKHDAEIVVYAHGSVSCLPTATYANMVTCPSYKDEGGRALPMGRPLSPKLVLRGDHYAFRCVVKDGGRPWVPLPPGLTVAAAQAMALEIATLAAKGTPDGGVPVFSGKKKTIASVETFADWSDRWLESREARGLTSARDDRSRLKGHVLPILGPKAVAKITRDDVENVVASLDAKVRSGALSWKTAVNVWGALSKALDDAANAKDRALRARADNPAAGVRGPDLGTKKVKTFLYPAEVSALLTSELVPLTFRRAVALAVYLGMRLGELHALRWSDVDLTEGTVLVHQAWDRKGKKTKAPKSNATRRFTFEAEARPLLAALHEETGGKGKVLDVPNYPNAASDLRDYLQKVGVTRPDLFVTDATRKQLSFHDLRATCLTWMALRGDNVLKIKARAGHADLQTTEGYVRTAGELTNVSPTSVFAPLPRALYAVTTDQIAGQNEEEVSEKPAENLAERNGNRTRQGRSRAPRRF